MDVVDEKTTFIQGTVKTIDAATQTVALEDGQTINYDYLVVSLGFESESFGIPGVQEHALQMVDVKTALNVYEHIQEQMRQYKATQNEEFLKLLSAEQALQGLNY